MTASTNTTGAGSRQADVAFQANLYTDPNPTRRWLHQTRRDWVMRKLAQYTAAPGCRVLEIGVGAGLYTRFLSARGCEVFAVDINTDFLNEIALLPGVMISCTDATRDLPVRNHDLALCSEVLEHVPPTDSLGMLRTLYRSVRPGGTVVFTTPQRTSTTEQFIRLLRWPFFLALARRIYGTVDDLAHINVLTATELQQQIRLSGFEIVEHTQMALYLPILAEFGGALGQRFAALLEQRLRNSSLSGLLWTQAYVLRRPA